MTQQNLMVDAYGRIPKKLRISITDRCNMHCMYCMPTKNFAWHAKTEILSYEEITRLAEIFARIGVEKIRLTGGEPLVRPQLEKLVSNLTKIEGIKKLGLTTNGLLLADKVEALWDAGLRNVNVSLDTLNQVRFKAITGLDGLERVQNSIKVACDAGFKVKVNVVVMRGYNDDEVPAFVEFAKNNDISVRFIEFMPLDGSCIWKPELVVTKQQILQSLTNAGVTLLPLNNDAHDPARLYITRGSKVTVGFISSISEPFCHSCDRLRLTSDGKFLTCLFEVPTYDVRRMLRGDKSDHEIETFIVESYQKKPEGVVGIIKNHNLNPCLNLMNTIGG